MKVDKTALKNYENTFNTKIDSFKNHKKYKWLRKYADDVLRHHGDYGFLGIKAKDFMDRINKMQLEYIQDWLDDKNQLELI